MVQPGYAWLALPPAIGSCWKLALWEQGSLLVGLPQFMSTDESLLQCRHLDYHRLLRLVRCLIHFDQIWASSGTHRGYHR